MSDKLDSEKVIDFFKDRADRHDKDSPLRTVIYQDNNPELALRRNEEEKRIIFELLNIKPGDRVIDIGCGIGRFTQEFIDKGARYIGTDLIKEFIDIARANHGPDALFFNYGVNDLDAADIRAQGPFNTFFITGLIMYLNDQQANVLLEKILFMSDKKARILIREPISILSDNFLLDNIWSSELRSHYSAYYRTHKWFIDNLTKRLCSADFEMIVDRELYPEQLNNRKETRQHLFILEKSN